MQKFDRNFELLRSQNSNDLHVRVVVGLSKTHIEQPNPPHWWDWTPYFVQ
jgi:hypothetical protein